MSIASEITRINNNIASAYTECENKGATLPQNQNSDNLATTIASISGGGGADLNDYFKTEWDENVSSSNCFQSWGVKRIPPTTFGPNVTKVEYFMYGTKFKNISFAGMDLSNTTSIQKMFYNCSALQTVDFANITNTSDITNVSGLCSSCSGLTTVSNMFPLTKNCSMATVFNSCGALTKLDLSNWEFTPTSCTQAFYQASKLAVIDISGLNLGDAGSVGGNMFQYCGTSCLQTDGAYADGIPYVYVKDTAAQNWVLNLSTSTARPSTWSTNNVVIKSN